MEAEAEAAKRQADDKEAAAGLAASPAAEEKGHLRLRPVSQTPHSSSHPSPTSVGVTSPSYK